MAQYNTTEIMERMIDGKYYNDLDVEGFARMMKDPSYCYKFYWLEAIVKLISQNYTEATYDEIITEMIVNAWYPVTEYHIHLSGIFGVGEIKDNLERVVIKLRTLSNLESNASAVEVQNAVKQFTKELHREKMNLTHNVPYKALSGFANKVGAKISLDSSAGRMMAYYNHLSHNDILLPYTFGEENGLERKITFSNAWIQLIKDNTVAILGWIQSEKVKWLQNNNPEVPGLIYKLDRSEEKVRKLAKVHKLWDGIRKLYEACYRDNLHSIWANQELYIKGNSREEFCYILDKNMKPVYDSARRQGYDVWERK